MSKKHKSNSYFYFKRTLFSLKFLFQKKNKHVTNFIDLKNINYSDKVEIELNESGVSYLPKKHTKHNNNETIICNDIIAYNVKDVQILLNSNAIYSKKNNTVYYENWNDQNETQICDYSSKEIVNHNENKAIIKYKISTERLNKAIFLGCTFPSSYYHFLVELISRTAYLSQIPNSKNLPIIISNSILQYDSLTTISSIFLKDYKVIYLNNEYSYEVDDLWYITSPNSLVPNIKKGGKFEAKHSKIRPKSIFYIRDKCFEFLNLEPSNIHTHNKIFIKRKANARTYNQDEIENCAKKYGFQSVYFEDLTFSEQLKTINNAEYIIGATGAAWTNLIFAKNGGKGLIWAESNWENLSMFSTIASIVNFDLNYMIFNSKTNDYHENYILELDVFENNLKKLLYL